MSVCSKWSREYGCRCCGDRDACHELGIDPLENATDAELEALDLEPRDDIEVVHVIEGCPRLVTSEAVCRETEESE